MNIFQIILILSVTAVILGIFLFNLQSNDSDSIVLLIKNASRLNLELRKNYAENRKFVINNNLALYSSYIIADKDIYDRRSYSIEVFVQFNKKYVKSQNKDDFRCVIKYLSENDTIGEIFEIKVFESPSFYWEENKKLIFKFNPKVFKSFINNPEGFDVNNIVIAVILKKDFDPNSNLDSLIIDLNDSEKMKESIVLPYTLIKFQVPTIIQSQVPRLPSVSLCAHYIHAKPPQLLSWFDLHLALGIKEIVVYDAMHDKSVSKIINEKYANDNRVHVMPFDIGYEDLCNDNILFKQFTETNCPKIVRKQMIASCKSFFLLEFQERYNWRNKHEQMTSNECFTFLSKKYEFIGYFDLDEFVFPRSTGISFFNDFNGAKMFNEDNFNQICSLNPFMNNINLNEVKNSSLVKQYSIYDYIMSLINEHKGRRSIQKLASISFLHSAFLIPLSFHEKELILDLKLFADQINNGTVLQYPLKLILGDRSKQFGHTFLITKDDISYVKDLYKSVMSINQSIYPKYLGKIDKIDQTLVRYLYYVTETNERMGKAIHYYKNVKSLFVHYAQEVKWDHWSFEPSPSNGHFLSHYRDDVSDMYNKNFISSIRKLNIDFEYVTFLLKNFTKFCK